MRMEPSFDGSDQKIMNLVDAVIDQALTDEKSKDKECVSKDVRNLSMSHDSPTRLLLMPTSSHSYILPLKRDSTPSPSRYTTVHSNGPKSLLYLHQPYLAHRQSSPAMLLVVLGYKTYSPIMVSCASHDPRQS